MPSVPAGAVMSFLKDTRGLLTWTTRDLSETLSIPGSDAAKVITIMEMQGGTGRVQSRTTGRKRDFVDAERLVKRLVARKLTLSFVPDAEQRLWRTVTRKKFQLRRARIRLQNQLESLLEEAHIKLSSFVSDLLGFSARRMLKALAEGEANPAALAALADERLRATPEQLSDALGACRELNDSIGGCCRWRWRNVG
jgi:hypothetical protein